jgi:hypothetical protein
VFQQPAPDFEQLTLNTNHNEKGPHMVRAKSIQGDGGGDELMVDNIDRRFSQKNTSKPVGVCRRSQSHQGSRYDLGWNRAVEEFAAEKQKPRLAGLVHYNFLDPWRKGWDFANRKHNTHIHQ